MPGEIRTALAGLALVCALGLGWYSSSLRAENKRLSATVQTLTAQVAAQKVRLRATDKAATLRANSRVLLERQHTKDEHALNEATASESVWAGERVPDAVARALGVQLPAESP